MRDRAEEIIENVISTWLGDNWERLGELAKDPDSASKLHRLQDYYREADIPALTRAEFVDLLRSSIWFLISGDEIRSPQVTALLLQTCLTLGEHNAILLAQQAAGMKITDGIMGPQTLEAINRINPEEFIANYTRLAENSQSMNTMPPQDTASPATENVSKTDFYSNQRANDVEFTQQAQTANAAPESEFTQVLQAFNVDAIAKKSTSDIWTIEDQLGYESYAQAIAKMIIDGKAEPPLTISVQAPWGQGKTSLMRMIKHKLEQTQRCTSGIGRGRSRCPGHPNQTQSSQTLDQGRGRRQRRHAAGKARYSTLCLVQSPVFSKQQSGVVRTGPHHPAPTGRTVTNAVTSGAILVSPATGKARYPRDSPRHS